MAQQTTNSRPVHIRCGRPEPAQPIVARRRSGWRRGLSSDATAAMLGAATDAVAQHGGWTWTSIVVGATLLAWMTLAALTRAGN